MSPAPLFHLPSALRRLRNSGDDVRNKMSPKREHGHNKAQQMLGISNTDMRIARNQSIASTASNRSEQPYGQYTDSPTPKRKEVAPQRPKLELKASSVLLHEEFLVNDSQETVRPPMPIKNFASSSTLHSHYDSQKVPLNISQQTSDSSRRDLALRRGSPQVVRVPFADRGGQIGNRSPKLSPAGEGRKLSRQRPKTSEMQTRATEGFRPDTGYESVPSIKSLNYSSSKPMRSSRLLGNAKPSANPRGLTGSTNKSLLQPLDPACVKVNVRRPRAGAKHWFDGLKEESSEDENAGDVELQPHFFTGLENAFQQDQILPPSDRSSVHTEGQTFHFSNSSVATPKQFLRSQSSTEGSPRVAVLNAKASRSSLAQHSTRSRQASILQRKTSIITETDLTKNSFLNLSASDDETEDERPQPIAGSVRSPIANQPPIRDSVVMAFNNDSAVEVGTAQRMTAPGLALGPQHSRVKTLKIVNRNSKPEQIRMPIPRRGSSLALSTLNEQAERQSAEQRVSVDLIPSFPATPTESDDTAYRMSISVFSDTASIESRRMMSVTKQEQSLLAAMRLKKAAMKHTVTKDKRLQALHNLEQGKPSTPPLQHQNSSVESTSRYYRQAVQPIYGEDVGQQYRPAQVPDSGSRAASGTTFHTSSTAGRQSHITADTTMPLNRLSLSSDSQSASPSLLSLATHDHRQSRDTYFSSIEPRVRIAQPQGHHRQRTESSHFSHVVELDKVPDSRDDIQSQDFIDWPYRGWSHTLGVAH